MNSKFKKVKFWLKFAIIVIAVFFIYFFIDDMKNMLNSLLIKFGFKDEKTNNAILKKFEKVETDQEKTEATIDFLSEMRKKYLK